MTDPETLKAARVLLRRIDEHDQAVAHEEGAQRESLNILDVVFHPTNALPTLNYLTPRRGAAWVSVNAVEQGITRLAELGRAPRLLYYEGLVPPIFRQTLQDFGLQWAGESQILATTDLAVQTASVQRYVPKQAAEPRELARWWNARSEFLAGGTQRETDTSVIQRMMRRVTDGQAIYLLVEDGESPVGIASLRVQSALRSAEINAFFLASDDLDAARALMGSAMECAAQRGCDLVFIAEALSSSAWLDEYAFTALGSVVAFAARIPNKADPNERVAQLLHP